MTIRDARAIEKKIFRYLDKVGGYQPYGWDWPTLRMLYPRMATVLKQVQAIRKGVAQ